MEDIQVINQMIEKVRQELNDLIEQKGGLLCYGEILAKSEELDVLILQSLQDEHTSVDSI